MIEPAAEVVEDPLRMCRDPDDKDAEVPVDICMLPDAPSLDAPLRSPTDPLDSVEDPSALEPLAIVEGSVEGGAGLFFACRLSAHVHSIIVRVLLASPGSSARLRLPVRRPWASGGVRVYCTYLGSQLVST